MELWPIFFAITLICLFVVLWTLKKGRIFSFKQEKMVQIKEVPQETAEIKSSKEEKEQIELEEEKKKKREWSPMGFFQ